MLYRSKRQMRSSLLSFNDTPPPKRKPWYVSEAFPDIPAEAVSSNTRTMSGLLKYSANGDLPNLFADSLNTNRGKGKAVPEYGDFLQQLHRRAPNRAAGFERDVLKKLTPQVRERLNAYTRPLGKSPRTPTVPTPARENGSLLDIDKRTRKPATSQGTPRLSSLLDTDIVERGDLLPIGRNKDGRLEPSVPNAVVGLIKALELPGDIAKKKPFTEKDVTDFALAASGMTAPLKTPADSLKSGVTRLRGTPKFMRKVDLEQQGQDAAATVMKNKASKPQAMFREDVGEITFDFGNKKHGLEHIRIGRIKKDGMTDTEVSDFVKEKVPEILAKGRLEGFIDTRNGRRAQITYKGSRVSLALDRRGNRETWIITAFEDF